MLFNYMVNGQFHYSCLSSEQIAQFDLLSEMLRRENQTHNLTRITDPEEIFLRHFCDSLAAVDILRNRRRGGESFSLIDIGSGAGFPALALAIALPELKVTSVDATGKKILFQQLVVEELGLSNVKPIHGRAEELARDAQYREKFTFAASRAVASLSMLAELTLPFVKPGGQFLAWKGIKAEEELSAAEEAIKILGGEVTESFEYSLEECSQAEPSKLRIIVISKKDYTPPEYPRDFKFIKKNPLGT